MRRNHLTLMMKLYYHSMKQSCFFDERIINRENFQIQFSYFDNDSKRWWAETSPSSSVSSSRTGSRKKRQHPEAAAAEEYHCQAEAVTPADAEEVQPIPPPGNRQGLP
ncbi:hypothetical protein J6590_012390 [Homalodisca vitripennis]|nr:hypothetical protein J6590_012390 [Homalodisca vitripennis]